MQKKIRIFVFSLFLLYVGLVMFFCFFNISNPTIDLQKYFLGIRGDRYAHFLMFFPYPFIAWLTINSSTLCKRGSIIITLVSGLFFAFFTELVQCLFIPVRQGEILDFTADGIGIILGTIIISFIGKWVMKTINRIFTKNEKA